MNASACTAMASSDWVSLLESSPHVYAPVVQAVQILQKYSACEWPQEDESAAAFDVARQLVEHSLEQRSMEAILSDAMAERQAIEASREEMARATDQMIAVTDDRLSESSLLQRIMALEGVTAQLSRQVEAMQIEAKDSTTKMAECRFKISSLETENMKLRNKFADIEYTAAETTSSGKVSE
jgi:hypothetical protein